MSHPSPVIIFGEYISAYGVIRGLSVHHIPLYMVSPTGHGLALKSRFVKDSIVLTYEDGEFIEKLDEWIRTTVGPDPVLIAAGDDTYLEILSKRHGELKNPVKLAFPEWDVVKAVREKRLTYDIARKAGIPVPDTYYVTSEGELRELINNREKKLNYPLFMKSEGSSDLLRTYGLKGLICHNDEELLDYYARYDGFGGELLLQDLIAGEQEVFYAVLMALNHNSEPMGYLINRKMRASGKYLGATFVESAWSEELLGYTKRLVKAVGYYGYVSVQYKMDANTGVFNLLEINGRISMSCSLAQKCGVNIPFLMYREAVGEDPPPAVKEFKQEYPDKVFWWLFPNDIFAYFRYNKKFMGFLEYLGSFRGKGIIIEPFNWRDPMLGFSHLFGKLFPRFRKLLKKLKIFP